MLISYCINVYHFRYHSSSLTYVQIHKWMLYVYLFCLLLVMNQMPLLVGPKMNCNDQYSRYLTDDTDRDYFTLESKIGYIDISYYINTSPVLWNFYSCHSIPPQPFPNLLAPASFCNRSVRNVTISVVSDYINILEFCCICLDF